MKLGPNYWYNNCTSDIYFHSQNINTHNKTCLFTIWVYLVGDSSNPESTCENRNLNTFVCIVGLDIPTLLDAVLQLLPLDQYENFPVRMD